MKLSDVKGFLNSSMDVNKFKTLISDEVALYHKQLLKDGTSASILFEEDDKMVLGPEHLLRLINEFVKGALDNIYIDYVANALIMSYNAENENVIIYNESIVNIMERLANQDIDGALTVEEARNILNKLN